MAIVGLLGRRDEPTDGVEDYCTFLSKALRQRGVSMEVTRVPWAERGWLTALWWLWQKGAKWNGRWILLQYTALGWSRRGFPAGLLPVLAVLQRRRLSCAVVFHDAAAYPGTRCVDQIRRVIQQFVMKRIATRADRVIMPASSENLTWWTFERNKTLFLPVGSNIPAPSNNAQEGEAKGPSGSKTIVIFGITEGREPRENEIAVIQELARAVATRIAGVRLYAFGRGTREAEPELRQALYGTGMEVSVFGLLQAAEIGEMLSRADVQIHVRGRISSRRGSVVAGIVCHTPVVGFESSETDSTIRKAGVVLVPPGDIGALSAAVIRILCDGSLREQLRMRNRIASQESFSWDAISDQLLHALRR